MSQDEIAAMAESPSAADTVKFTLVVVTALASVLLSL
jgi:hypothetical protein